MTLDQFFDLLPRGGWKLTQAGCLRRDARCPINAVADGCGLRRRANYRASAAAAEMGLPDDLSLLIIEAADEFLCVAGAPALRKRLLAHCGLDEAQ